jgi:hypothetical protein
MTSRPEITLPVLVLLGAAALVSAILAAFRPDSNVAAAVIAAVTALFGSTLSVTLGRYFERRREIEVRVRDKKVPEYEKFVDFWFGLLYAERLGRKKPTQQEMMRGFIEWTKPLIMWGSDDAIRRWGQLRVEFDPNVNRDVATEDERRKAVSIFKFEELLLALRRDAGYPETTLGRGDILRLWINDIDRYL